MICAQLRQYVNKEILIQIRKVVQQILLSSELAPFLEEEEEHRVTLSFRFN